MTQRVKLQTIEVVARPQIEMRIPKQSGTKAVSTFEPISLAAARQQAPWLVAPPSLPAGHEFQQAFDASIARPDGSRFPEFHLIYVKPGEPGMIIRQALISDYPRRESGRPEILMYGELEPMRFGDSPAALLTVQEMVISASVRIPAIARVYTERDGVLIEVEVPPKWMADAISAAHALVASK
jgi:hypothetical protein